MKILKGHSSYKSQLKVFKLVLNAPPSGLHKTTLDIFEILSFQFLKIFFEHFKFTIVAYGEIFKNKTHFFGKRATVEQNGVIFGTHE